MKRIGFIGCGNMAQAMIKGIYETDDDKQVNMIASNPTKEKLQRMKQLYDVDTAKSNLDVVNQSDFIILAVKPQKYEKILTEIREDLTVEKIVGSIAAGKTIGEIEEQVGNDKKIVRIMPNTPVAIGEGMSIVASNQNVTNEEFNEVQNILSAFGKVCPLDEDQFDAATALSGSSPAMVYVFIEAMADAGVKMGLPRDTAYELAAQAVVGSGKMVRDLKENPAVLKDKVCSPGGTTIEMITALEREGFRNAVIQGVVQAAEKSQKMR